MISKNLQAWVRPLLLGAVVIATTGCDLDSLLEVSDPSRLLAENVETPAQIGAIMSGVEADFICAHGAFVLVTAALSDELEDTNAGGDNWSLDRRRPEAQNTWSSNDCLAVLPSAYVPASRARWVSDNAVRLLESWTDAEVPQRQARIARAALLGGFSLSMLGAAHCSAALDEGPEMTPMQIFAEAEARFSKALDVATAAGQSDLVNAARVGRARVRLYQGNKAGALSDAEGVSAGFVMNVSPSDATARMYNRIWQRNLLTFSFGVPEWTRNLTTGGVTDPRTATYNTNQNTGWAPTTVWAQRKYSAANSPMPIARWAEAQLIIAEVVGGQRAVGIINALRGAHGLPTFASTNEAEIQRTVAEERQRELWFEGFRSYDIHRLGLDLVPATGAGYQVGLKGGTYGEQTCIPMPQIELFNNRTIRG